MLLVREGTKCYLNDSPLSKVSLLLENLAATNKITPASYFGINYFSYFLPSPDAEMPRRPETHVPQLRDVNFAARVKIFPTILQEPLGDRITALEARFYLHSLDQCSHQCQSRVLSKQWTNSRSGLGRITNGREW